MGIPKLMQDLSPYTEHCSLGRGTEADTTALRISSLVIDGPSFVYHVLNRQMRSVEDLRIPLPYRDINESMIHLLDEMRSHGVEIKRIYFDGALPVSKRHIRLDRLEKHRQTLERLVRYQGLNDITTNARKRSQNDQVLPSQKNQSTALNLKALEPPFMVPSAIEHLKHSSYASVTEILPDEAEMGCIAYASNFRVAMLSNDSDLVVFPAASNLPIVLLSTLEEDQEYSEIGKTALKARYLMPSKIECRLQISSLHLLAFQRSLDPMASFGVIKQRAKTTPTPGHENTDCEQFHAQYQVDASNLFTENQRQYSFIMLDPRLSELHYQYEGSRHSVDSSTALHMYLPSLFEEPSREAPWTHGADLRQLAYSLLNLAMPQRLHRDHLIEFQRRGPRIGGVEVMLLKLGEIRDILLNSLLQQQVDSHSLNMNRSGMWQHAALQEVSRRRHSAGRAAPLPRIHLHACVQAVLYSLRLLKQVVDLFHDRLAVRQVLSTSIIETLATLPALVDLMDGLRDAEE